MSLFTVKMLKNDLPKRAADLRPKASRVVKSTALGIETDAKGRAAVDTGAMRASIATEMDGDLSATVAVGVEYGVFVEFGTSKQAPQPFMTPAAEAARGPFEAAMREVVG